MEENDLDILIREHCPKAFSRLMDRHMGTLRSVVYRIVLNVHDADDVVQETLILAFRKIHTFNRKSRFSTWICAIGYRQAYTFLRRKSEKRETGLDKTEIENMAGNKHYSPVETKDEIEQIHRAMSELPYKLRSAISLVVIDGRSVQETAEITGSNTATTYWRIHKARKILKEKLGSSKIDQHRK